MTMRVREHIGRDWDLTLKFWGVTPRVFTVFPTKNDWNVLDILLLCLAVVGCSFCLISHTFAAEDHAHLPSASAPERGSVLSQVSCQSDLIAENANGWLKEFGPKAVDSGSESTQWASPEALRIADGLLFSVLTRGSDNVDRALLLKIDSNGRVLWTLSFDMRDVTPVQELDDGYVVEAGERYLVKVSKSGSVLARWMLPAINAGSFISYSSSEVHVISSDCIERKCRLVMGTYSYRDASANEEMRETEVVALDVALDLHGTQSNKVRATLRNAHQRAGRLVVLFDVVAAPESMPPVSTSSGEPDQQRQLSYTIVAEFESNGNKLWERTAAHDGPLVLQDSIFDGRTFVALGVQKGKTNAALPRTFLVTIDPAGRTSYFPLIPQNGVPALYIHDLTSVNGGYAFVQDDGNQHALLILTEPQGRARRCWRYPATPPYLGDDWDVGLLGGDSVLWIFGHGRNGRIAIGRIELARQ
jgi:hypothetical protein